MSNPNTNSNPRKRAAPGHLPLPSYAAPNVSNDQMIKWDGSLDGLAAFGDAGTNGDGGFGLVQGQPQYSSQNAQAVPSNSLTRRPMNQALVPTRPRGNFDPSAGWDGLVDNSLVTHGQEEQSTGGQDAVEALEELAQQAKRDAQAKRKQIPPFVQKLSR